MVWLGMVVAGQMAAGFPSRPGRVQADAAWDEGRVAGVVSEITALVTVKLLVLPPVWCR
jgi:hypothetical protein